MSDTCNDCWQPMEEGEDHNGICFDCAIELWDEYMLEAIEYSGDYGLLYRQ